MDLRKNWKFLLLALLGIVLAVFFGASLFFGFCIRNWPSTPGRIEAVTLSDIWFRGKTTWEKLRFWGEKPDLCQRTARVEYSYHVGGSDYRANRISDLNRTSFAGNSNELNQFLSKYGEKTQVSVYYDPSDPGKALLEKGIRSKDLGFFLFSLGLLVFGMYRCSR